MFDILVFLFQNYYGSGASPDYETLARKLTVAGFDDEEIDEALDWLSGLGEQNEVINNPEGLAASRGMRLFTPQECQRLSQECRGYLTFLEHSGLLTASQREAVIGRILALPEDRIELGQVKVIVLMVLWAHQQTLEPLVIEELLCPAGQLITH